MCSGEWVAVIYDEQWFPGLVEQNLSGQLTVNFMARSAKRFIWPDIGDRQILHVNGVLCKIEPPYPVTSRHFVVHNNDAVDALCQQVLSR